MKYSVAKLDDLKHSSYYPDVDLPPLWNVIYHEAVRDNHILFERKLIDLFEKDISKGEVSFSDEQTEYLVSVALQLVCTTDFQEMRYILHKLDYETKKGLYVLYTRAIELITFSLRTKLN